MKTRIEAPEKVKEDGPKKASYKFKLGKQVVAQNSFTKLWDTHGIMTKTL